jgi:hypothetical protein
MIASAPDAWTDSNQRLMVAEFARLKALLASRDTAEAERQIADCRAALTLPAAIDHLTDRFALTPFERDVLLLAAGVEMDAEFGALCADAGSGKRPWASFGLALAVLPAPHWSALTPMRPLRRWRLLEASEDATLACANLRIDERVLHYMAGVNYLDLRLKPQLRRIDEAAAIADQHKAIAQSIANELEHAEPPRPALQLAGGDLHGKRDLAAWVAARAGLQLHCLAAEDIPASPAEREALAVLWEREAALLDSALLIECGDGGLEAPARRFLERVGGVTFLALREAVALSRLERRYRVDKPDRDDQLRLWQQALGATATRMNGGLHGVVSQFRLSARDIARTGSEIGPAAALASDPEKVLWQACRNIERPRLEGLAQRIDPAAAWDDLILPAAQKTALQQIALHVRHRLRVYDEWGFARKGARGMGIAALFAGESGTGKTMAAEVLAGELNLELFRIDLSAVVNKYIGETEKNLARVFDAAEDCGAILLFDEADALFGKRSEVKDSHDRYANIEVSYLLQRMEAYRGLAILTSNQKTALDPAFLRRLRFVVQFPFPDALEREAIWRRAFPAATPTAELDFAKLARMQMAGGHIRNIALNAAFLAADAGLPVGMAHLLRAAQTEASKRERPLTEGETRGWV